MTGFIDLTRKVGAPPSAVFGVLADGWLYASWSVGAVRITDVDPRWPEAGSRIWHSVGLWPLLIPQVTEVLQVEHGHRVLLRPRRWPFGDVEVSIEPDARPGGGSLVLLRFHPARSPAGRLLQRLISRPRGRESLARLTALAEARSQPGKPGTDGAWEVRAS